jgi:phage baseplate assembly protein V
MSDAGLFDRLMRRVFHTIARVRILSANDGAAVQRVQAQYKTDDLRTNIPRVQEYGFSSNPPSNTDAIVVHIAGERSQGVVIATNDQASRPTGQAAGDVTVYDNRGRYVKFSALGLEVFGNNDPVIVDGNVDIQVTCGPGHAIRLNGTVVITGDVEVTGDITQTGDFANFGALVNNGVATGSTHKHAIAPAAVGTGGDTGVPGT